ncbi:MAG TPA: DUF192 domain-containing protein [Bacteroidota bacterium]|nr:DUF192 domain-containing protein [Bacteroidota bacterium]
MSKTHDAQQKNHSSIKRQWIIGAIAVLIIAAIAIIAMPKKSHDMTEDSHSPMFKKQGTLTFLKKPALPITTIDIEIADDDSKREVGLMGRPTMEEQQGMLFVFEQAQFQSFWMHNTILPLDMLFIDASGTIKTIHKNTTPFSDQTYQSTAPVIDVLEVLGGFTDKYNISVGDRIEWKRE